MSNISEERLLGLIRRIYDAALEPQQWQEFVDDLAGLFSGTAALTTQDSGAQAATISAASGIDPAFARSYEAYYCARRPWANRTGTTAVGQIFTPRSLFDRKAYERTEYFNDWLKPQDIYHLSSCTVARADDSATFLTLSRPYRAGEFAAGEFALVRTLTAHLQQGLALHQRLLAMTQERDLLALGLEGLGVGAILVDGAGHVRFANEIAEDFLRRGDGLVLRQRRLQARTAAATSALRRMINAAARIGGALDEGSGGVLALPCDDGRSLHALICPLPAGKIDQWGGRIASALIFISDAARNVALRPADLMRLYGLTRAEAKLMSALVGGQSLDDYADATGTGRATVKTHLQQIFQKMDWHRQSDVVRGALASGIAQIAAFRNGS